MDNSNQISPQNETIKMDTCKIDTTISSSKAYKDADQALIILYNPNSDPSLTPANANPNAKYIGNIHGNFNYNGILSNKLTRELFGWNKYNNGDWYAGMWENDSKHGLGIYCYTTQSPDEEEYYIGQWVEGKKEGKGMYIWKHSSSTISSLGNSPNGYNAIIGAFANDVYVKGLTIRKGENSTVIYEGKYNEKMMKNDEDAVLIENGKQVFYGQYAEDVMKKGTIVQFKEENRKDVEKCFEFKISEKNTNPDNGEIDYDYELLTEDTRKTKEEKAISIMKIMEDLKLFETVEQIFSDGVLLQSVFNEMEKLQITSFDSFFGIAKDYIMKEFTLKTA